MKIAIIGSRDLKESWVLPKLNFLPALQKEHGKDLLIISGGARGVDSFVQKYCDSLKIPIKVIKPINAANKLDYLFRNVEIITLADKLIIFWDKTSKGTKFVINYARKRDKEVVVIER